MARAYCAIAFRFDDVRPDVARVVEPVVASDEGHEVPVFLLDRRRLAGHLRRRRLANRTQPLRLERAQCGVAQPVVGRRHAGVAGRGADVRTEMHPGVRVARERRIPAKVIAQAEMPELVAARRDESHRSQQTATALRRFGRDDGSHGLQPAHEPTAALRRVRVPAAARRHHAHRRQRGIAAAHQGDDVDGLDTAAGHVGDEPHLAVLRGCSLDRARLLAGQLQDGRAERLAEPARVHGAQSRLSADRDCDDRGVLRSVAHPPQLGFAIGPDPRPRNRPIASDDADSAGDSGAAGERPVEHRQAVDLASVNLGEGGHRIDARQVERLQRNRGSRGARASQQCVGRRAIHRRSGPMIALVRVGADDVGGPAFHGVRFRSHDQQRGHFEELTAGQFHRRIIDE